MYMNFNDDMRTHVGREHDWSENDLAILRGGAHDPAPGLIPLCQDSVRPEILQVLSIVGDDVGSSAAAASAVPEDDGGSSEGSEDNVPIGRLARRLSGGSGAALRTQRASGRFRSMTPRHPPHLHAAAGLNVPSPIVVLEAGWPRVWRLGDHGADSRLSRNRGQTGDKRGDHDDATTTAVEGALAARAATGANGSERSVGADGCPRVGAGSAGISPASPSGPPPKKKRRTISCVTWSFDAARRSSDSFPVYISFLSREH
uniref:Uncharacterized protein n=1 Tax=Leersia perrieri TaxID=77586 RepID=A0A0D9VFW7_9ORYZ